MTIDFAHIGLLGLAIHLVVRALKAGRFSRWIPARFRPLVAIVLGGIAVAIEALAVGIPWRQAVVHGAIAVATAVLGHDVVIEMLRGGREFGRKA